MRIALPQLNKWVQNEVICYATTVKQLSIVKQNVDIIWNTIWGTCFPTRIKHINYKMKQRVRYQNTAYETKYEAMCIQHMKHNMKQHVRYHN